MEEFSTGGKVNLYLKVTGKRPDGYHSLRTLFLPFTAPADRILCDLDAAPGIRVRCDGDGMPQDLDNLAGRAADLFARSAGIAPAWSFTIVKHLPAAAGVGGGSADAGAVLRCLYERYPLLPESGLRSIALSLGADVPFFLNPVPSWAGGVGEELQPLHETLPAVPLVLLAQGFPVSAKWGYTHLAPERIAPADPGETAALLDAWRAADWEKFAHCMHNDLEYALFEKFPLLRLKARELAAAGALRVMVSGSGPSLLALLPDAAARRRLVLECRAVELEQS